MTRPLVLLLTDIVDSTAMHSSLGDAAMKRLWQHHDQLARALLRSCHGQEIGRTDGLLLVFPGVNDAASFARRYHEALQALEPPLEARVGIHAGDVEIRPNSPEDVASGAVAFEIDGVALPVAARIVALARGRQTLLSAAARALLEAPQPGLASHGHWRVKGVAEPIELFELADERAPLEPPADGEKAYRVVRDNGVWLPSREIRHSLPAEADAFIGRDLDLRRLADLLELGARQITVVGVGGVGKTRLVTHFARQRLGEFQGGAWFCDLADVRDADALWSAVSLGLGAPLGRAEPRVQLADVIAAKARCLIVLDNFEQIVSFGAEVVAYWVARAPKATFLVTSRERLGGASEHVVALDSLEHAEAVRLFSRRATASHPRFREGLDDADHIGALVDLLDGLPLAIELAVGRLGVMTPASMLMRISRRFTLLASRSGRVGRQSTLRAAFDWSWDLLAAEEQHVLAQASVFVGGFDLEAAETVLRLAPGPGESSVLDALQSLVDKSFLRFVAGRFGLLVSVREYAEAKRAALVVAEPHFAEISAGLEQRHSAHYADRPLGQAKAAWIELDNILAVCRRAIAGNEAELAARACWNAWTILESRGPFRTGIELLGSALQMGSLTPADRSRLAFIHGRCLLVSGEARPARAQLELARSEAGRSGSALVEARALSSLAELSLMEGEVDAAGALYEEAVQRAATLGDVACHCSALNGRGLYFIHLGEFEAAGAHFREALALAEGARNLRWQGAALNNLVLADVNLGDRAAAQLHCDRAIRVARELEDKVWEGNLRCNLGLFKLEGGDADSAREDLERSLELAREAGVSLLESVVLCNIGLLHESISEWPAAEASYRAAVQVARRRGDRRSEGQFLGYLGLAVAMLGEPAAGREMLVSAIAILRQVRDKLSLAIALARYARASARWDDPEQGRPQLDEATRLATEIKAAPGSELLLSIAAASPAGRGGATAG